MDCFRKKLSYNHCRSRLPPVQAVRFRARLRPQRIAVRRSSLARNRPRFPRVFLRGLHGLEDVDQTRQIQICYCPRKSFLADEKSPSRQIEWLQGTRVLNLSNYDFPHEGMSFLVGSQSRNAIHIGISTDGAI